MEDKKQQNKLVIIGVSVVTVILIVVLIVALKSKNNDTTAPATAAQGQNAGEVQTLENGETVLTKAPEKKVELATTLNKKGEVITDKDGNPVKVPVTEEDVWENISVYEETKGEIYLTDKKGEYVTNKKGEKVTESYDGEADGWSPLVPAGEVDGQ